MAQSTPNTRPSPLARVKSEFGDKKQLIEKVKALATAELWVDRLNSDTSFDSISNAKLLHLHAQLTDATKRFGSRDKLIEALVSAEGRGKDQDYRKHFAGWPVPRLLSALSAAEKRTRLADKKAKAKAAPKA